MSPPDFITSDPDVRSGRPCLQGTRMTVADVLEYLAGGMTEAEICADFPAVTTDHIRACLAYAAARGKHPVTPSQHANDLRSRITSEPGKCGGKPCIRGMRIRVIDVLEMLASGMTTAEILADFPDLEALDIAACLDVAAAQAAHR